MTPISVDDDTIPTEGAASLAELAAGLHLVATDWGVASTVGYVRSTNEDAWGQDGRRFVVADGMGGHQGGALASRTAVRAFLADHRDVAWTRHLAAVNDHVRRVTAEAGTPEAGSTLVAVGVQGRRATVVSVGDSRVYRCRSGMVEVITLDHTLARGLFAAGVDAEVQRRRGIRVEGLTSYLGADPDRFTVDLTEVELLHGDRLVLVTDGVWAQVGPADVAELVGDGSVQSAADGLVAAANAAGGVDNATALVVEFGLMPEGQ